MAKTILGLDIALGGKVDEEGDDTGSEGEGWDPRVRCPSTCHTNAGLRSDFRVGWVEKTKMYVRWVVMNGI